MGREARDRSVSGELNRKSEIGRFLHLKSEIRNNKIGLPEPREFGLVQFHISDFGFEMQESSNFKFPILTAGDTKLPHLRLERGAFHAQARRRAGRTGDDPLALFK